MRLKMPTLPDLLNRIRCRKIIFDDDELLKDSFYVAIGVCDRNASEDKE